MDTINQLVATLRQASYTEREGIKEQLLALVRGPGGPAMREALETARKGELLEVQWEIEEVLEKTAPPKPAAAAPPPPPPEVGGWARARSARARERLWRRAGGANDC